MEYTGGCYHNMKSATPTRVGQLERTELDGGEARARGFPREPHARRELQRRLQLLRQLRALLRRLVREPLLLDLEPRHVPRRGGGPRARAGLLFTALFCSQNTSG